MQDALLIHGMPDRAEYMDPSLPSPSNAHWLPWLQKQLLNLNILAQTLEMPQPFQPDYAAWSNVLNHTPISNQTILVGHSGGAGFLVRWLSKHPIIAPATLILVAPWLDPEQEFAEFFNFAINPELNQTVPIELFVSEDDSVDILQSVNILCQAWPKARLHQFSHFGHFTQTSLQSTAFPEPLEVIKQYQA